MSTRLSNWRRTFVIFTAALAVGANSCGSVQNAVKRNKSSRLFKNQKKAEADAKKMEAMREQMLTPMRLPMGSVHMVHPQGNFVLIRSGRSFAIEAGTEIQTYGPDGRETAKLQVSPARRGDFVTADVLSGSPSQGDQAVMNYVPKRPAQGPNGSGNPAGGGGDSVQVLE